MPIIRGNILDQTHGIIGHQVNCQLVMGAGLAKQIRDKYPRAFTQYRDVFAKIKIAKRLGKAQIVEVVRPTLYIANLFGQYNFLPRHVKHTDYPALTMALRQLRMWRNNIKGKDFPIYLPFGLGCGLAGGEWRVVEGIIRDVLPDATIVKLPEQLNKG
jgi:O-acetyl-ADP-ribose deacetylase (regulator of RNase III)